MMLRALVFVFACSALFAAQSDNQKRIDEAAVVLKEVMDTPDKAIPQGILDRSECIVIVPGVKKAAFIVGTKYGRGFLSCRHKSGEGWIGPGSVRMEGGSFGLQIGGSETDVIMVVMNEGGVNKLLGSKFTVGGDASAAAGPVGRTASAETDAQMRAEILTWSRARGLFAGISLNGATLRQELSTNKELYGSELSNRDIVTKEMAPPKAASELIALLNKYSGRKGK